jgi:TPR repeat protein
VPRPAEAKKHFTKACLAGHGKVCETVAMATLDLGRATAFYEKACGLGVTGSCFQAGYVLYEGRKGLKKDKKKGAQLLGKACEAGHSMACQILGR